MGTKAGQVSAPPFLRCSLPFVLLIGLPHPTPARAPARRPCERTVIRIAAPPWDRLSLRGEPGRSRRETQSSSAESQH